MSLSNQLKDPVESLNLQVDSPHNPIGQILAHEGRSLALVDLGRDASKALRASWPTDQPPQSGGAIDSSWLLPMLGAGSTAASSLMAGSVFLATANPATLMTIGTGVGTAVMGPAGIVAQAPFIAASRTGANGSGHSEGLRCGPEARRAVGRSAGGGYGRVAARVGGVLPGSRGRAGVAGVSYGRGEGGGVGG